MKSGPFIVIILGHDIIINLHVLLFLPHFRVDPGAQKLRVGRPGGRERGGGGGRGSYPLISFTTNLGSV